MFGKVMDGWMNRWTRDAEKNKAGFEALKGLEVQPMEKDFVVCVRGLFSHEGDYRESATPPTLVTSSPQDMALS